MCGQAESSKQNEELAEKLGSLLLSATFALTVTSTSLAPPASADSAYERQQAMQAKRKEILAKA